MILYFLVFNNRYSYIREVVKQLHRLRNYRESYGFTVKDLSILSDISIGAIHRIESGNSPYKTNEGVAFALAAALDVKVSDLFDPSELSHLGRPPHTGKPITMRLIESHEMQCPECYLIVPQASGCDQCDIKVA